MEVMLEFRAGIAIIANGQVTPDSRKGMLRIAVIDDLVHFQWLARTGKEATEPPEIDFVIFPEEADITKDVHPGARYLHLRFKDPARQDYFFWMQEPNADQDEEFCSLVQQLINMGDDGNASESQPTTMDQLEGVSGMMKSAAVDAGDVQPALTQEYLAAILSGINNSAQQPQQQLPTLSEILTPQNLMPLLEDENVKKRLAELVVHMPKEHQTEADKQPYDASVVTIRSAPLRNQVRTLSHALASGQLDFSQLGLEHLGFSAADFLRSIQQMADKSKPK